MENRGNDAKMIQKAMENDGNGMKWMIFPGKGSKTRYMARLGNPWRFSLGGKDLEMMDFPQSPLKKTFCLLVSRPMNSWLVVQ